MRAFRVQFSLREDAEGTSPTHPFSRKSRWMSDLLWMRQLTFNRDGLQDTTDACQINTGTKGLSSRGFLQRSQNDLLADMDISEWVKKTHLSSPITERAVLLVGRHRKLATTAIGSGVFIADRLIMTARHVVQGYWDTYNNPNLRMEKPGKKIADFEMFAVQAPGNRSGKAR